MTSIQNRLRSVKPILIATLFAIASQGFVIASELQYDLKPDQTVAYEVTISAETPSSKDTMTGLIAFTGKDANDQKMNISYVGNLNRKTQSRSSNRSRFGGSIRRPIPSFFGRGVTFGGLGRTTNQLVLGRSGTIRSLTGQSQLPYLLGNLSILPFEALPNGERKEWTVSSGISVTEEEETPFFGGPFRGHTRTKVGGSESAEYRIVEDDGKLVRIEKKYHLTSPAADRDDQEIKIDGTGTYVFNREMGVPESLDMKQTYQISKSGSAITFPLTVKWKRVPEKIWLEKEQQRAEMIAKARSQHEDRKTKAEAAAKAVAGKRLDSDKKKQIMADLNSARWPVIAKQLRSLERFVPHPDDFDVALRIKELQTHKVLSVYKRARELWVRLDPIVEAGRKDVVMNAAANENPFATGEEKNVSEARKMRQWSDATGNFKVQAEFVKFTDKSIVLKRVDGKEIDVPIAKLSAADQKVAALLEKVSAQGENPFQ